MPGQISDAVFIPIHYQNENCHADGRIKIGLAEDSVWRGEAMTAAKRLLDGMRTASVPVVHVRLAVRPDLADVIPNTPIFRTFVDEKCWMEGSWGTEFLAGFEPAGEELVVTHIRNNGFYGSDLDLSLHRHRPRQLYISGVSTAYAVESTVRHATDIGYEVTVISDACTTATRAQHDGALRAMSLLAEIKTADEVLAELNG